MCIRDRYLRAVDKDLYQHLKLRGVEPQVYLLRWIRCIFVREFSFYNAINIWDALMAEYYKGIEGRSFTFIDCICLSMLVFVRLDLLDKTDAPYCLQRLLKFPPVESVASIIRKALEYKDYISANEKEILNPKAGSPKAVEKDVKPGKKELHFFTPGLHSKKSDGGVPTQGNNPLGNQSQGSHHNAGPHSSNLPRHETHAKNRDEDDFNNMFPRMSGATDRSKASAHAKHAPAPTERPHHGAGPHTHTSHASDDEFEEKRSNISKRINSSIDAIQETLRLHGNNERLINAVVDLKRSQELLMDLLTIYKDASASTGKNHHTKHANDHHHYSGASAQHPPADKSDKGDFDPLLGGRN
eukprot:TRINITY_DN3177_c0_g2_i7.p1 TRINITY_DN3177_c0_g2~~TRINITY_DN3177_c0_g2_i7.p1  ORF type:complete len:356 (+),score=44.21 TRINITY_DN3177_c0_g2_i7:67-1134(+)